MNERNKNIINPFLDYVRTLPFHKIAEVSKLINKERDIKFPRNRECKYAEYTKSISEKDFKLILNKENKEKIKLAFEFMYYLGLRVSEVVEIQTEDFNCEDWLIKIKNQKCCRIDKLIIPIRLRKQIINFMNNNKTNIENHNNYLFFSNNPVQKRDHISKDWLRNHFRKITLDLNINKIYAKSEHDNKRNLYLYSCHSLRHAFGRNFYNKAHFDIEKTRIALRHRKIKDTQTYIKSNNEEVFNILAEI